MTETLREVVKAELPAGMAALPAETQDDLAQVLIQARRAQGRELKDAANSMLDIIPGFLRGAVKKAAGL
jgi:hypothetical protein